MQTESSKTPMILGLAAIGLGALAYTVHKARSQKQEQKAIEEAMKVQQSAR